MSVATQRYITGEYDVDFGDDQFKAEQILRLLANIPDLKMLSSYADVGCGNGGTFAGIYDGLIRFGCPLERAVGYDLLPEEKFRAHGRAGISYKRMNFFEDDQDFDLITLNDVIEHVLKPQEFCSKISQRARYVAFHIPLDDRLSVLFTNQFNCRLQSVGHVSFWSPATALNLLTASGLLPIHCCFTPGFKAPSSRARLIQRLAHPFRWIMWRINPGLMSATIGGVSLAVLCRGQK
ncbi:MAG TPA: methyltransferase domain-containing protein [Pirellulales bacterium]|jgi:SAM-dependent methyltransferase|nr:methyltransferase domain-containing protein [Pirellulales bacterium]